MFDLVIRGIVERIDGIRSISETLAEVDRLAPMLRRSVIDEGLRSSRLQFVWSFIDERYPRSAPCST